MALKYNHLLSPIKVNNVVLRNRLIATPSNPHFIQGQENWPTEALITHYANKAKNGAAIVTIKGNNPVKTKDPHSQTLNIHIGQNQHYFAQCADVVHYYGAKASYLVLPPMDLTDGYGPSATMSEFVQGDGSKAEMEKEAPKELLYKVAEAYAEEAALAQSIGFDMCFMHMAYRLMFPGRFLSPISNKRTDEFGGSVENRARFPLMICEKIKERCGKDFLVHISISGREDDMFEGGLTVEDQIEFAKLAEGKVDILQIRGASIDPSQPTYLDSREIPQLDSARRIKKGIEEAGIKMLVDVVGGCQDLDHLEQMIADGEVDMIGAARSFIADPHWGEKAYEGRGEDVVPCLRCNKCHIGKPGSWLTVCSVNPEWGLEHKIERMISEPGPKKNIAVIGGGPTGMEAALLLSQRGHAVTLYEKTDKLGGLINYTEGIQIKWTLVKYRDYMVRQIEKSAVNVVLNTTATPELIASEQYDEVIVAIGAQSAIPPIPGVNGKHVYTALQTVEKEPEMGENVVVIGGGEIGVEMGLHIAKKGHKVHLIEMRGVLSPDSVPVHFRSMFEAMWEKEPNFTYTLNAACSGITDNAVLYKDADGVEHSIPADSVVIAAGMKAKQEEAMTFFTGATKVHMIGDCDKVGCVQTGTRAAYALCMNI